MIIHTYKYIIKSGVAERLKAEEDIFQLKRLSFNYLEIGHGPWVLEEQGFL